VTAPGQIAHVRYPRGGNDRLCAVLFLLSWVGAVFLSLKIQTEDRATLLAAHESAAAASGAGGSHIVFVVDTSSVLSPSRRADVAMAVRTFVDVRANESRTALEDRFTAISYSESGAKVLVDAARLTEVPDDVSFGTDVIKATKGFFTRVVTGREPEQGGMLSEALRLAQTSLSKRAKRAQPVLVVLAGGHPLVSDDEEAHAAVEELRVWAGGASPSLETYAILFAQESGGVGEFAHLAQILVGSYRHAYSAEVLQLEVSAAANWHPHRVALLPELNHLLHATTEAASVAIPVLVAAAVFFAFVAVLQRAGALVIFFTLTAGPISTGAALFYAAHRSHILDPVTELALIAVAVVAFALAVRSVWKWAHLGAASLTLGARVLLYMPGLVLVQSVVFIPVLFWGKYVAGVVAGVDFGEWDCE
jgi:hypothetical protein